VKGWQRCQRRKFDVGIVRGPWGTRRFIEGVGFGLIGRVIEVLERIDAVAAAELKRAAHRLYRDACVATALAETMNPISACVSLDGRDVAGDFLLVEILNIRRAGPAVELAPHSRPSDGRFDVALVSGRQRARLLGV